MQVSRSNVVTWFTCSACCMRHTALLLGFFEDMLARQSLWKRPDSFVLSSLRVIKAKPITTTRCHFPVSIFLFRVPESPSDFKSPQIKCSITFLFLELRHCVFCHWNLLNCVKCSFFFSTLETSVCLNLHYTCICFIVLLVPLLLGRLAYSNL